MAKICRCYNQTKTAYYNKSCTTSCNDCCPHGGHDPARYPTSRTGTVGGRNGRSTIRNRRSVPTRNRGYMRSY